MKNKASVILKKWIFSRLFVCEGIRLAEYARQTKQLAIVMGLKGYAEYEVVSEAKSRLITLQEVRASARQVLDGRAKSAMMFGREWVLAARPRDKQGRFTRDRRQPVD